MMFEDGEIEEVLRVCAWVRRLAETITPALQALVDRVGEVEKQCRVWDFRRRYREENDIDD